jgi:predicted DNA-binding transcriptional regulator AlpA
MKSQKSNPKKRGAKVKLIKFPETQKRFLEMYKQGVPVSACCDYSGISKKTFYNWISKGQDGDPEFLQFLHAVRKADRELQSSIISDIKKNGTTAGKIWLLKNRYPEHYRDEALVIKGDKENPVEAKMQSLDELNLSQDTINELAAKLIKRKYDTENKE